MEPGGVNIGYTDDTVWVRGTLENPTERPATLWLEIGTSQLDRIRVWPGDATRPVLLGDHVPPELRASRMRLPTVHILLGPGESTAVRFAVETESVMSLAPRILDGPSHVERQIRIERALFWAQGWMVSVMMLFALLAIAGRDRAFAWFAVQIGAALVYHYSVSGLVARYIALPGIVGRGIVLASAAVCIAAAVNAIRHLLEDAGEGGVRDWGAQLAIGALALGGVGTFVLPPAVGGPLATLTVNIGIWWAAGVSLHGAWLRRPWGLALAIAWTPLGLAGLSGLVMALGGPISVYAVLAIARWSGIWLFLAMAGLLALRFARQRRREVLAKAAALSEAQARAETEAALAEAQRRAHRLERADAIGRLAGGVAHDINNLLTVLVMNTEAVDESIEDAEVDPLLDEMREATGLAADLVRQLLAYSRRQPMQRTPVDVHELVRSLSAMLDRMLGERVELDLQLMDEAAAVHADRSQLEQVLVNLVVNARDAMPDGGRITIRTERLSPQRAARLDDGFAPTDDVVAIHVVDEGAGISPEALPHIFDPFFTTREDAGGTGLGLATAMGVVLQHEGWIEVTSPGAGSTFTVLLPLTDEAPVRRTASQADSERPARLRVLLAEDQEPVRRVLSRALVKAGLDVRTASNGEEALRELREHDFDLLVSDMVMPGANGATVAAEAQRLHPGIATILVSGYAQGLADDFESAARVKVLGKPFKPTVLIETIHELVPR